MTKPITEQTTLERVREMTRQALEREAEKLLALDVVKERISDAAGEGFTCITVAPDRPVDLSKTLIGRATAEALKSEGFGVDWAVRINPDGPAWFVLVVNWGE